MISGVSSYSSYSSYSSTLASSARNNTANSTAASCSGGPAKAQEKLFSILDSDGNGSVAKEELDSALSAAKESDSSLTIDIDELFSQLDANSDGSIDKEETAALAPPPPHRGPGGTGGANPEELFGQLDRAQFSAGDAAPQVFEWHGWGLGLLISYDVRRRGGIERLSLQVQACLQQRER